ncbi:Coenzyme F420 hydrogenase/dehydrogenase, beta subunit C-terminal domain [Phaeovulum sp.]|uniref:Coenzyme F420 hydrogenase/dehydrogenase, beta subunit C-terminal domain n=1 Tax=Phaeovulum sp. TaxID=2934796 RepID=UPI0039E31BAE
MTYKPSPTLQAVLDGQLCCGCGGCAALAPNAVTMHISEDGYLRPVQSQPVPARFEERFSLICPGVRVTQDPAGRFDHPLWGPLISMNQGHATNPDMRRNGSSGGALSALLVHLLETGAVDGVVQVGADPLLPIGNKTVLSLNAAAVFANAGSRYAPSAPLEGIDTYLDSTLRYAFVGKPCDVSTLRAMEAFDDRVAARFPYMLSFFCAGVPSLAGAREVLGQLGAPEDDVTSFRYRGDGWPGFATATLQDGTQRQMSYADSWGGILSRHVQFRCKICPDGTGGFADVVCADAWEADARGYPVFIEREGISLIVSRTVKGLKLVQSAVAAGSLEISGFETEKLAAIQPGQTGKRRLVLARLAALKLTGRALPRYRGFYLWRNARSAGLVANMRNLLGTLRRIWLKKL